MALSLSLRKRLLGYAGTYVGVPFPTILRETEYRRCVVKALNSQQCKIALHFSNLIPDVPLENIQRFPVENGPSISEFC